MPAAVLGPVLGAAIGGGASIVGGALANKHTQSTTPTLDPAMQPLQNQVLQMIQARLAHPSGVPAGYVGSGIRDLNASADAGRQATENALTSRGLGTSPIAGHADLMSNLARAGSIGRFRADVPRVARQLQNQDLGLANTVLGQGRGLTQTGTSGGGAGGAFENLAGYLGYLQGLGKFPGQQPGTPRPTPQTGGLPEWGTSMGGY